MSGHAHGRSSARGLRHRRQPAGFSFTVHMRRLCEDIVTRTPQFAHVDLDRVAVSFAQTRKLTSYGLHASLTPMRFEGGALTCRRHGQDYSVQRLYDQRGREYLYILTFYLPRFMNLGFHDKLITVFHELWHVSPDFDGDLRRHDGRCYAHTHSQKQYDAEMDRLARDWLADSPPRHLYEFLESNFAQLRARHGRVFGVKISRPKLLPIS